jgi:hypothetical protein
MLINDASCMANPLRQNLWRADGPYRCAIDPIWKRLRIAEQSWRAQRAEADTRCLRREATQGTTGVGIQSLTSRLWGWDATPAAPGGW